MQVAVASTGEGLDAAADPRFGRCSFFVVVDTQDMSFRSVENTAATQGSGAGIAAAQLVADSGADAVIAANLGPNAHQALSAGGLDVYVPGDGTVRQAVEALIAGNLQKLTDANVASHSGMAAGGASVGSAPGGKGGGAGQDGAKQVQDVQRQIDGLAGGKGTGDRP